MRIPLSVRMQAFFARDKDAFWWSHFTDEEKELRRMDVWQLAGVLEEAAVRPGMEKKRIVAEHMLSVRLAQIQAKASWGSGILGFGGAIVGAALSVALASAWQRSANPDASTAGSKPVAAEPAQASASAAQRKTLTAATGARPGAANLQQAASAAPPISGR